MAGTLQAAGATSALSPTTDAAAKALATLQARAALLGVALIPSTDDRDRPVYIASRWGMTRQLDSVEAVEEFLRRVGGPKA